MAKQVLDLSRQPAKLRVDLGRLRVEVGEETHHFLPDQLQSVILASHGTELSQNALACLAKAGVPVICCDEKHTPVGILQPLGQNITSAERITRQAELGKPQKKRLWQQLVKAKLLAQAVVLKYATGCDGGLEVLAGKVRSGDPDNLEGQGARRYWRRLFSGNDFSRVPGSELPAPNAALNYGYAVLRALTVKAICAAGLHPALGLHHHNRYDSFRLASDLMEPYRPLVDLQVWKMGGTGLTQLKSSDKKVLIQGLLEGAPTQKGRYQLPELVQRLADSLAQVVLDQKRALFLPRLKIKMDGRTEN